MMPLMKDWPEISEKSSIPFKCQLCGDCCRGDMTIPLNLNDLQKMTKHLKLSSAHELTEKSYIQWQSDDNSVWRPVMKFRNPPYDFCPFLSNKVEDDGSVKGLCTLHPYKKPLVCNLAPMGKILNEDDSVSWCLVPPTENCPGMNSKEIFSASEILNKLRTEMSRENTYFRVLEHLYDMGADRDLFIAFHDIGVQSDYDLYIEQWLEELLSSY